MCVVCVCVSPLTAVSYLSTPVPTRLPALVTYRSPEKRTDRIPGADARVDVPRVVPCRVARVRFIVQLDGQGLWRNGGLALFLYDHPRDSALLSARYAGDVFPFGASSCDWLQD